MLKRKHEDSEPGNGPSPEGSHQSGQLDLHLGGGAGGAHTGFSGEMYDGELPAMEDSFFEDFDFCPTLEDLLEDPLLADEWPQLQSGSQTPGVDPLRSGDESSHSTVEIARQDLLSSNEENERSCQSDAGLRETDSKPASHSAGGQSSANSNAARESTPEGSSPEEGDSDEKKRLQRMMRNRESASLSRERKKMQMAEKEKQLTDLQGQLNSVSALAAQLGRENALLRQEVARLCQQSGHPFPQVLMSCPPMLVPPGQMHYTQPHPGMSAPIQKVAIQRMPVSRPAPAVCSSKSAARVPKRRKQQAIAGGTTAMAALFCLMYFGGMPFTPSTRFERQAGSAFVPITQDALNNQGRVLQSAVEDGEEVTSKWLLPQEANHSNNLVIQPTDLETESKALQHLKDIGPVAIFSKYDTDADQFISPAPWKSLTSLADSALARDGISKSARCEKVFSVDVSAVEDPELAKRQLQKQMADATSFKGRYQALAVPPSGTTLPALDVEANPKKGSGKIACEDTADDDYIISVMMPTKDQLEGYTEISKLYVVVLNPNKKYTTYACRLDRPVLI